MTLTAKHIAAIHYLESRGGRASIDDGHFEASVLLDLHLDDLVLFTGFGWDYSKGRPDGTASAVALRHDYRTTLRGLLLNAGQQDDSEVR